MSDFDLNSKELRQIEQLNQEQPSPKQQRPRNQRRESYKFFGLAPKISDTMTKERSKLQKFLANPNPFSHISFGADFDDGMLTDGDHRDPNKKPNSGRALKHHASNGGRCSSQKEHGNLSLIKGARGEPRCQSQKDLGKFPLSGGGRNKHASYHGSTSHSHHPYNGSHRSNGHKSRGSHSNNPTMDTANDDSDSRSWDIHSGSMDDESIYETGNQSEDDRKRESRKQLQIAQKEHCHVRVIRSVTIIFIAISALGVCLLVYGSAVEYDLLDFESKYGAHVVSIKDDVSWEIKYNQALMKQLSTTLSSGIYTTRQTPPFVTIPNYEVLGGFTDGLSGIMMTAFVPLINTNQMRDWESYSIHHQDWLDDSARLKATHFDHQRPLFGTIQDHEKDMIDNAAPGEFTTRWIPEKIWYYNDLGDKVPLKASARPDELIAPIWQTSPADPGTVNVDLLSNPVFSDLYASMEQTKYQTVMSSGAPIDHLFEWMVTPEWISDWEEADEKQMKQMERSIKSEPHACLLEPVFANFKSRQEAAMDNEKPIGLVMGLTSYRHLFELILPDNNTTDSSDSVLVELISTGDGVQCGTNLTYRLDGPDATFIGYTDLQSSDLPEYQEILDKGLDEYWYSFDLELVASTEYTCKHTLAIYPTPAFKEAYRTQKAQTYTVIVGMAFLVTSFCFIIYERLVTKREKTKNAALEVVASLFPSAVQDEVLRGVQAGHHGTPDKGKVIASFFPATTIMFADIAGFTAWSSTREPEQVFRLLETVYGAMDQIAIKRGVFKVETVGDCYVAVCGLPEPREDHAVAMTRFARDCQLRMASLSRQLEIALGPDTADLCFRIGIHSGPVTGGVLRGQNARFQLFGDSMNQASRMESTGIKSRIQMSTQTAKLLIDSGKGKWIEKRPDKVDVKGKGLQETYFLKEESGGSSTIQSVTSKSSGDPVPTKKNKRPSIESIEPVYKESDEQKMANKTERLVSWNTEVLLRRIRAIIHHRMYSSSQDHNHDTCKIQVNTKVVDQLQRHVRHIASMYRVNPFHNYEHASHVTLSMEKMLSNVKCLCPSEVSSNASGEFSLNAYTNDLKHDPLAQFAVVYSALIHDVDHSGCSNAQLVKENDMLAIQYGGKSPAENHSINLAWTTLMLPEYRELVDCLCPTTAELERLKQLITDAVLATDIFDVDLIENRNMRWKQVFGSSSSSSSAADDPNDDDDDHQADPENVDKLRVMIVLDHLIQASDVAHTMQHWHVYIKWNERLYNEMTRAYRQGRLAKDPSEFWYQAEIGFFDKYVIPLAKKLRDCGVFGVSCYEFLNYAETNRNEWEMKGRGIVKEYVRRYQEKIGAEPHLPPPRRKSLDACATSTHPPPPMPNLPLASKDYSKGPPNNPAA